MERETVVDEHEDLAVAHTIPDRDDLLVLVRLAAATVAARGEFDVDEIADLRLAVDELCLSLTRGTSGGTLRVRFALTGEQIEIGCEIDRVTPPMDEERDLSVRILEALVDEYGHQAIEGGSRSWLRKRRVGSSAR